MSADQTLRGWLDGLRRRWQALTRLRVSARQAAAVAVIAGAAWAVDAATSPTGLALVGLFIVAIVAAVAAVIGLQAPLRRPPSDRQLARLAEEQNGELDDVVVTATERLSAEAPGPLDGLLVRAAEARLREVEPERVIARRHDAPGAALDGGGRRRAGHRAGVRLVAGVARGADGAPLHRAADARGRGHARARAHRPRHAAADHRAARRPARRRHPRRAGADRRRRRRGAAADAARGRRLRRRLAEAWRPTSATASSPGR